MLKVVKSPFLLLKFEINFVSGHKTLNHGKLIKPERFY